MSKMKDIASKVRYALEVSPEARSDDRKVIEIVYDEFYGVWEQPFYKVLQCNKLPSFESIRRARQKIQELHPELRAVKAVEDKRIALQEDYLEFAMEGDV